MSATIPEDSDAGRRELELISARFVQLVVQQTNLALMLLGRMPHPETGGTLEDLDGARLLIDQLEMLEVKTRGNLSAEEDKLLRQSLTALRMAFVEAMDHPAGQKEPPSRATAAQSTGTTDGKAASGASAEGIASSSEEAPRKKFTKKY